MLLLDVMATSIRPADIHTADDLFTALEQYAASVRQASPSLTVGSLRAVLVGNENSQRLANAYEMFLTGPTGGDARLI